VCWLGREGPGTSFGLKGLRARCETTGLDPGLLFDGCSAAESRWSRLADLKLFGFVRADLEAE
jgi:hypothetical protein